MKEHLPIKDLKTSVKVLGIFTKRTFEGVKPSFEREAVKQTIKLAVFLRSNNI